MNSLDQATMDLERLEKKLGAEGLTRLLELHEQLCSAAEATQAFATDPVGDKFQRIFSSVRNHSRRGASFARVVQQMNRLHFSDETDVIVLSEIYEDLVSSVTRVLDAHYWLDRDEVGNLAGPLQEVRETAHLIVDEFQKVEQIRRQARKAVDEAEARLKELLRDLKPDSWRTSDAFVQGLADLRKQRGQLITLRGLRHRLPSA